MKDKLLFTPGPLTTSATVKEKMLTDLGSRDFQFIKTVQEIRGNLLELGGIKESGQYETILMQGAGTFGLEAVTSCAVPKDGKLLLIINGAYGYRMQKIADIHGIETVELIYAENDIPDAEDVETILNKNPEITHITMVHCETTTGIFNDLESIGTVAQKHNKEFIVDAMSSFGAVEIDFEACNIDYLISSSNKCIEGVPGFSFILAKKEALLKTKGQSRTLSLDMYAQWEGLEKNGQFRFTPPTHTMLAFHQAIEELKEEGGVIGRANRYKENYHILTTGMREIGFKEYLLPERQGYIITSFLYPENEKFEFAGFYEKLNSRNLVIYPGKLSQADCFRIGNIGKIFPSDVKDLLSAIKEVLVEMEVELN